MIVINHAAFALVITSAYAAFCPNGWVPHDDSCYLFSRDKQMWPVAAAHCAALNAQLPIIETEREDNFLQQTLRGLHANDRNINHTYYSIGGTDIATETEWVWAKTHQPFGYTGWGKNEPDSIGDQDCLVMGGPQDFMWNDSRCTDLFFFICEMKGYEGGDIIGK
uniref:C-type lectin domain-containing protein n=1 Tax=Pinctada fucata TaxID=50426 RepID=A0A194AQN2_PINFU